MECVETSIEIDAPVQHVYNQWTQFEEFPRFMQGVEEVRQLDNNHLHWVADVGGKRREWDAEIFEQVPDEKIAWRSTSGARNIGVVHFKPLDQNRTELHIKMNYDPEGVTEHIGDMLGVGGRRVEGDLKRFKEFLQKRQQETGAWRGKIHHGRQTSGNPNLE